MSEIIPEAPAKGSRVHWVRDTLIDNMSPEERELWLAQNPPPLTTADQGTVVSSSWPVDVIWDKDGVRRTMFASEVENI